MSDFLKNAERMCNHFLKNRCKGCLLYVTWRNAETNEIESQGCLAENIQSFEDIATAIEMVQEWTEDHPLKTRKQDFFEKHPNALEFTNIKMPKVCAKDCGYCKTCDYEYGAMCKECWDEPVED